MAVSGQDAGGLRDLLAFARQLGTLPYDLDEIVHEVVSLRATQINNSGLEAQLSYLIDTIGADQARQMLQAAARTAAPAAPHNTDPQGDNAVTGTTTTYRARRALTDAEITAIRTAITAAGNTAEILTAAVHTVFTALLAPLGESLADYSAGRKLDPAEFAIPRPQWEAIAGACTAKADAYGTRIQVAMELINTMPASYDDPSVTVPPAPETDYRPHEHVLTVSREATDVIAAATRHCAELARHFGTGSREYQDAAQSWQHNLTRVFSMAFGAHTRVSRDGELSLLVCSATGFTYGIIFHPGRRHCTRPGCTAVINDDGHAWTYRPDDPACPGGDHAPSYPLDAPQPGTWSFHS